MEHQLMTLPYAYDALAPALSSETLEYHHAKHHAGYVKKLNTLIKGTKYESMTLEDIIKQADGPIFNNASQVFNHKHYFSSLTTGKSTPSAELSDLLEKGFGSMEAFKAQFLETAAGLFGSGWVWLSIDKDNNLQLHKMCNANSPLRFGLFPLLTCDVWEHAYYIDYRNDRARYLEQWWELVDWRLVSERLAEFMGGDAQKYLQECPESTMVCDYLDELQNSERIES